MAAALTKVGSLTEQTFVMSLYTQCLGWPMVTGRNTL